MSFFLPALQHLAQYSHFTAGELQLAVLVDNIKVFWITCKISDSLDKKQTSVKHQIRMIADFS